MNDTKKVSTGKPAVGGAIYRAPFGTALPTDALSTLSAAWKCLGYVSEDGVTNDNTPETDNIKAWGGDVVLVTTKSKEDSFGFTLIEVLNVDVLKTVYGEANVSGDLETGITIKANNNASETASYVIDMILNGDVLKRIVIPSASVSDVGTITYKDDEAIGYETTMTCKPDAQANTHYEYIQATESALLYTVAYESNGGSAVASEMVEPGEKATEPTDPTKDGYTFGGWYLPTDLSTPYDFNTAVNSNITLYAKWS